MTFKPDTSLHGRKVEVYNEDNKLIHVGKIEMIIDPWVWLVDNQFFHLVDDLNATEVPDNNSQNSAIKIFVSEHYFSG